MTTAVLDRKVKVVHNSKGRPVEVILPYSTYKGLRNLQISMEIYHDPETQASIMRAKKDVAEGRVKGFQTLKEAFEWLDE